MKTVKVKRDDLLARLKTNRKTHRETFEKAQVVFRERVISELDKMLERARKGDKVNLYVNLPTPEDHTDDYDRAIDMLEMSVDTELELTAQEFQTYARDQWGWAASFESNTRSYAR